MTFLLDTLTILIPLCALGGVAILLGRTAEWLMNRRDSPEVIFFLLLLLISVVGGAVMAFTRHLEPR